MNMYLPTFDLITAHRTASRRTAIKPRCRKFCLADVFLTDYLVATYSIFIRLVSRLLTLKQSYVVVILWLFILNYCCIILISKSNEFVKYTVPY